jgi:hypothetical protein
MARSRSRKLHPALKKMSGIVRQLSRNGVKGNLIKKAAKIYRSNKKSFPRMKSALGGRMMW